MKASERLEAAKAGKEFAIRKIAEGEAHRREALLAGDDGMAQAADLVIAALRLALKRREDEIELLREPLQREQQEERFPPDIAAARALLQKQQERFRVLRARHQHSFDAATQQEMDAIPAELGRLQNHIVLLERMA
jgi:hypothetical protein